MTTSSASVETIPFAAWFWLWETLSVELGPERAAELLGHLRRIQPKGHHDGIVEKALELGGSVSESY
jgi:hypothetical protein